MSNPKENGNKYLSILKPNDKPHKKVLGFDIETEGDENNFVLACFYSDDLKYIAKSKQEVIDFLQQKKIRNYYIYATNLAFDFLGTLYEKSDFWDVSERNGVIYSFKWYQRKRGYFDKVSLEYVEELMDPVHFFDTIRIFPASVEKLGKILKQPKLPHPSCFGKIPKNQTEENELMTYCMNDAKISYLFIKNIVTPFLEKYSIKMGATIGSIAMKDFRTNHLKYPLFREPKINHKMAFGSYYGGRTETYKRGTFDDVYCFDVNSLYPSAMLELMPNPNKSRYLELGTQWNIDNNEGVSFVKVFVPKMYMPPLPKHHEGKLIFPTGHFEGYYNHNELRNAMKYGVKILDITEQLVYPETDYLFKSFITLHYAERLTLQANEDILELMEKNTMNNLYGKFAFNYSVSSEIIPAHKFNYDKLDETIVKIEPICNDKFISIERNDCRPPIYSFPILSSYITSYARIVMYKYLNDKKLRHKLISTDTDSIFLTNYDNEIKTSKKLGDMKLEDGYPVDKAIFIRPKMYYTHKPKCKGISFKKDTADKDFKTLLKGQEITQQRFVKLRTALRSEEHHKFGKLKPNQIIPITKSCDLEDNKRIWTKGFQVDEQQDSTPINL